MLKAALDFLAQQARHSANPIPMDGASDHLTKRYALDGVIKSIDVEPSPRDHIVRTLQDLIDWSNRWAADDTNDKPVLWYSPKRVVAVLDNESHRCQTVTFPLEHSDTFETLKVADGNAYEQAAFIRLLRVDLAGALEPRELLEIVRRVQFENGQIVTLEKTRDRESLGKQINSVVRSSVGEIPEEVTLRIPLYSAPQERVRRPIQCAVEVDTARGKFALSAMPDEFTRAIDDHMADVFSRLEAGLTEGIAAYYGEPKPAKN